MQNDDRAQLDAIANDSLFHPVGVRSTIKQTIPEIVEAVRAVTGPGVIGLQEPSIGIDERASVVSCMLDGVVSYQCVDEFQALVGKACGTEQALVTSSGTAALHLALMVSGVGSHTEVLCPALTFVGTANAITYCGAVPNFVDVRSWDFGISPFKLGRYLDRICERRQGGTYNRQSGRPIKALIAVDLLGVPCDLDAIKEQAGRHGIPVIEDAAQALGSVYKGRPCGSNGYIGIISFNNNKIITTNGGGALVTNDPFAAAKAWELSTTARISHPWKMDHSAIAWNYRMGNINAALGIPQIKRLDVLVEQKTKLHKAYAKTLDVALEGELAEGSRCNYWLNALQLPQLDGRRDEVLAALYAEGIQGRTLFTPLHLLPFYASSPRDNLEGTQNVWQQTICLPSSPKLGELL